MNLTIDHERLQQTVETFQERGYGVSTGEVLTALDRCRGRDVRHVRDVYDGNSNARAGEILGLRQRTELMYVPVLPAHPAEGHDLRQAAPGRHRVLGGRLR